MLTITPVAESTRDHRAGEALGRAVLAPQHETLRTASDSSAATARTPGAPARPQPPGAAGGIARIVAAPLGVAGGLARLVAAMVRHAHVGPGEPERVRANADRLLETIRMLSGL